MKKLCEKYGKIIAIVLAILVFGFAIAQVWSTSKTLGSFQTSLLPVFIPTIIIAVVLVIGLITNNEKMIKANTCLLFSFVAIPMVISIFNLPVSFKTGTYFTAVNFAKYGWAFSLHYLFAILAGFALIIALLVNTLSKYVESELLGKIVNGLLCFVGTLSVLSFILVFVANGNNLNSSLNTYPFDVYHFTEDLLMLFSVSLLLVLRKEIIKK